jgi:autophagy-related protein 13
MLTSQEEVADRLRIMNEVFLKSLEGISSGVSGRERRRRKERELELERERESQRLFEREKERQEDVRRYERDWELERERERRYYYGYDEQYGLGLGLQSIGPTTTTKHAEEDSHVGIDIHPSTPPPTDSPVNAPPTGITDLVSTDPSPPPSPSPSPPRSQPHQPFRTSYAPSSRVGRYENNASPTSYSPMYAPAQARNSRTSLGFSQGSEEVIGRMELPDDREGRSIYDTERERERKIGIGGNRFRGF